MKTSEVLISDDSPPTDVWHVNVMIFYPSIGAAFLAPNQHSQVAHYSQPIARPTRAVMYNYLIRCLITLITQCRAILEGVDMIIRRLVEQQESEKADFRASEYWQLLYTVI
jgi:hypothetical protein